MAAQKVSFSSLYLRNAKGVWNDLPSLIQLYPIGPMTVVIKFLLLPLTLTIGPGIKSLIDYFTRRPLSSKDHSSVVDKLSQMSDKEIETCAAAISGKYSRPKSKSSNILAELLKDSVDERRIYAKEATQIKDRKVASGVSKLKTDGVTISSQVRFDVTFSEAEFEEIKARTAKNLSAKQKENTQNKRDNLVSFFSAPHNAGKKMQHVIMEVALGKSSNVTC